MQMAEFGQLGIITLHRANAKSFLNISGYQKGCTGENIRVELRQEDMYSRQIEVAEMNITVGDGLQPITQVGGLGITRYKQEPIANLRLKKFTLATNQAKVLHVLNSHHNHISWNRKRPPVCNEYKTALMRTDHKFMTVQQAWDLLVRINREPWAGANFQQLGITCQRSQI